MRRVLVVLGVLVLAVLAIVSGVIAPSQVQQVIAATGGPPAAREVKPAIAPVSSWGRRLNPDGLVYASGFKAFYFDRTNLTRPAHEHFVENVAVKYSWDDLHGINSEAFAAYWVGLVEAEAVEQQTLTLSLSWSRARVFVNGELVQDTRTDGRYPVNLRKGANLVEVEYINNWHTTEFKLTIGQDKVRVAQEGIGAALAALDGRFAGVHFVGLYESGNQDTSVAVKLPREARGTVLWLDSYEAIDWQISPDDGIAAIVVASYTPGARVLNAGTIPVIAVDRAFGIHAIGPTGCSCSGAHFSCEHTKSLIDVAQTIQHISGLSLTGYATSYSATSLATVPYDAAVRDRIGSLVKGVERQRAQCDAQRNPDFDKLFGDEP